MRRFQRLSAMPLLVAFVLAVDLVWALLVGSTGTVFFGFIDEPAHLATCAVGLLVLAAVLRRQIPRRVAIAALSASVLIDLDHLPGYLGSHLLSGSDPRPVSHSLALVLVLFLAAACTRRPGRREIWSGLGFGVAMHLFRDIATGPGVPLVWPLSTGVASIPYTFYAAALVLAALPGLVEALRPLRVRRWAGAGTAAVVAVVALPALLPQTPAEGRVAHGPRPHVSIGAYIPHVAEDPGVIDEFENAVGRSPAVLSFYQEWGRQLLVPAQVQAAAAHGSVPMITWEPWSEDEEGASLSGIAGGAYDGYIRETAREVAGYGQPVFIRFAHEMNGDWYPWGWGVDGNTPTAFIAAWRHVVSIFREEGAGNVRWVWCPYADTRKLGQFKAFYPGDEWVDWVALDGFNWGTYRTWQSFNEIFAPSYRRIVRFTRRPIMIGEIGVNQSGGNKARWLSLTLSRVLPRYRNIRAVVWFDAEDGRADFRVNSSPRALAAFRRAVSTPFFGAGARRLLSVPPELPDRLLRHRHRERTR